MPCWPAAGAWVRPPNDYAFPLSTGLGDSEIIRWRESYGGDYVPEGSLTDVKLDVIKDIKFDSIGESY